MNLAFGCFQLTSLLLASLWGRTSGEAFLGQGRRNTDAELQAAMASVMGCGAPAGTSPHEHVEDIKLAMGLMWDTLPKNRWGRVEWSMVRYAAHRYFMQQFSFLVRGLEPAQRVNSSSLGNAEILSMSGQAGPVVDMLLKGKADGKGFTLEDVAFMLATLERVVHTGEGARLEEAYLLWGRKPNETLALRQVTNILETYMIGWMLGEDEELKSILVKRPELRIEAFPLWDQISDFAFGILKQMEFEAFSAPRPGLGRVAMRGRYSFEDVHRAVGYITRGFASFWESECLDIKADLVAMDRLGIGRVAIPDFYGANTDGNWRFGESEVYLRELGALDETSAKRGNQVIIPNYLQGASNCLVTTPYYMVCCANECEGVLNEIHGAVGAPSASADMILRLVKQMASFDDEGPSVAGALTQQLQRIEQVHGGEVPLHGRLFAQWLHYLFPRECPFPHKTGASSSASVAQFGDESFASDEDIRSHSARRNVTSAHMRDVEAAQWMSQWSEEEDLDVDLRIGFAPWDGAGAGVWIGYGCGATALLGLTWSMVAGAVKALKKTSQQPHDVTQKSHFV